jgi:hypothetical protein
MATQKMRLVLNLRLLVVMNIEGSGGTALALV